jgi:hypothetical protein
MRDPDAIALFRIHMAVKLFETFNIGEAIDILPWSLLLSDCGVRSFAFPRNEI